ncbi:hypothetical protein D2Q93_03370 [Alicyclobacillaceae bacterium I2511]|nr:hypothetical protein D2Q93_03370 [Alicyclobacillaceae bacterium I2511]
MKRQRARGFLLYSSKIVSLVAWPIEQATAGRRRRISLDVIETTKLLGFLARMGLDGRFEVVRHKGLGNPTHEF